MSAKESLQALKSVRKVECTEGFHSSLKCLAIMLDPLFCKKNITYLQVLEHLKVLVRAANRFGVQELTLGNFFSWSLEGEKALAHLRTMELDGVESITLFGNVKSSCEKFVSEGAGQLHLFLGVDYSGTEEFARVVKRASQNGKLALSEEELSSYLDVPFLKDPQLALILSPTQRLPDQLIWQMSYTELLFSPLELEELTEERLISMLQEYCKREKRYGK